MPQVLLTTYNASGAAWAASQGLCVMIVDVINMSTTAEAVLEEGAFSIWGAASDRSMATVCLNPEKIGFLAAEEALSKKKELVIITEPRVGSEAERKESAKSVLAGITKAGAACDLLYPNLGMETVKLTNFKDKIVILVTDSGGVAFDAAWQAGAPMVITGTNARTMRKKGYATCQIAVERAISFAQRYQTGIAVIAASSGSCEDILAAEQISQEIIKTGFLNL